MKNPNLEGYTLLIKSKVEEAFSLSGKEIFGVDVYVTDDEDSRDYLSLFGVYEDGMDRFELCAVKSYVGDDMTTFTVSFVSNGTQPKINEYYEKFEIPFAECREAIVFATKLSGMFSDENSVYELFAEEYMQKNTSALEFAPSYNEWKAEVEGLTCSIRMCHPDGDGTEGILTDISFSVE